MDPDETYYQMFCAMRDFDHETAREHAQNLSEWLSKGGCWPQKYSRVEVAAYIISVIRRTGYLA